MSACTKSAGSRNATHFYGFALPPERKHEAETRFVETILSRIQELEKSPLTIPRLPEKKFAGTCRDFALLLCAMLRHHQIPARVRCGFESYFLPGKEMYDHWVCEYWNAQENRWVLVDCEVDAVYRQVYQITIDPEDVPHEKFVFVGRAWQMCRSGEVDPHRFRVMSMPHIQGMGLVRSNVVRELAVLNKMEVLPWDYWEFGDKDFTSCSHEELHLVDRIAAVTTAGESAFEELRALYEHDTRLQVPTIIKSYTSSGIQMVRLA